MICLYMNSELTKEERLMENEKIKLTSNKYKLTKMNWHVDFVMNARKLGMGHFMYVIRIVLVLHVLIHTNTHTHTLNIVFSGG